MWVGPPRDDAPDISLPAGRVATSRRPLRACAFHERVPLPKEVRLAGPLQVVESGLTPPIGTELSSVRAILSEVA